MLKAFVILAMVMVITNGCVKTYDQDNTLRNGSSNVYEKLTKLPYPFAVIYGESGKKRIFSPDDSVEEYVNLSLVFMYPGFITIFDSEAREEGMDKKLEEIFKSQGFNLVETKEHVVSDDERWFQMNFVKNGENVVFID